VHITGWAMLSHFWTMRRLHGMGIPVLFRGDSHLLDDTSLAGVRGTIKTSLLTRVFSWPSGFLVVGAANRSYYERFGVEPGRLYPCRHSIDVGRFADRSGSHESEASSWREELGISQDRCVLLFSGKFERKKRPIELMRAVLNIPDENVMLVMVGNGELDDDVNALAATHPTRFRVLPFQNQTRMPVVYRLGDLFVLPSAYGETWGLAVNEALASGRPVLVSDRVGCAHDVVDETCGQIFSWNSPSSLSTQISDLTKDRERLVGMRQAAALRAWSFDISQTEAELIASLQRIAPHQS
jgi:glycosyltransferase involved in cell wall biosynthesis